MKKSSSTPFLILLGIVALGVLGFFIFSNEVIINALLGSGAAASDNASITDIAASYYGNLTREVWPAISGLLPIEVQCVISILIVLAMIIVGAFFPKARGFIILLTFLSVARNMLWRGVDTLNFDGPVLTVLSILIYLAEVFAFTSLMLGYFQIWKPTQRNEDPPPLDPAKPLPSVDVMVCTYNEPVSVLYRTLVGCNNIEYPKKTVYLLDDGNREEMAQLAQHLGVTYIAREKNTHAKAGNLNNALEYSSGELVLVFDADHVPTKHFLNETIGFFQREEKLAFVQTPQHFFTIDPFQRNLAADQVVNNEQDFFFHVIQPGNDHWDSTFFAGSGAIFRRVALEETKGFAVETVTEDVHTGLRLHAKGWKSVLFNKNLAAGLAQDSFADFVKQRLRWARGMTQIFFNDFPLFTKGLSLAQRLCYFSGIIAFFNGLYRLVFLTAPLFFLLFGFMTINAGFPELLIYYIPSFLCLFWGYSILSNGYRHVFWAEIYETALCFYTSLTAIGTLLSPKRSKFKVTPKGTVSQRLYFNWRIVVPQLLIAVLIVVGLIMATYRSYLNPGYIGGIFTNLFWACYNLVLLIGAIYVAQERPQFRLTPRIHKRIRCELRLLDGTIAVGYTTNISESGLAVAFDEPIPVAGTMALKVLDWDSNETSVFSVQAIRSVVDEQNRHYIGLRVVNRTDEQHQKLVRHMFGSADIWQENRQDNRILNSFFTLLKTPFRLSQAEEVAFRRRTPRFQAQLPCVVQTEDGQSFNAQTNEVSETGLSLTSAF